MCGIAGLIDSRASAYAQAFCDSLAHRGPDASGIYIKDNLALVHTRLAIQDLSAEANQPMYSADGTYVIVYNGEIYNHWEIRKELFPDFPFRTSSDTETLLQGYITYGSDILHKLNGIFTFAIFNTDTRDLFIARDPFGVKPLYYYHDRNTFLFSSEIKSFLNFPGLDTTPDFLSLHYYVSFLYTPGSSTPFSKVKKLEAGHFIRLNSNTPGSFQPEQYYEIPFNGRYSAKSEAELTDELEDRLRKAVKRQLLSDVPVGFFLSGGLDSSLIVAMAKRELPGERLKCFTIDTHDQMRQEGFAEDLPYAKQVAAFLDVDLEIIKAEINILEDFDQMVWHLDEPQADAAPLNVWNICKRARELGYVVLLGGTGGDDLFSGYRRHTMMRYRKLFSIIPKPLIKLADTSLSRLTLKNAKIRRLKKILEVHANTSMEDSAASYYLWQPSETVAHLFTSEIQSKIGKYVPESLLLKALKNIPLEHDPLNQMLYWEIKYFLTDHNLNYTDKMSMAHGIEVRVPYLDKELVEFSTTIPPALKMKGVTTKYILKKVAERYLPREVIYRSKTGFAAPVRKWIAEDLYDRICGTFTSGDSVGQNLFDGKEVLQLVEENKAGKTDASYSILALLAITSWHQQFIEKRKFNSRLILH